MPTRHNLQPVRLLRMLSMVWGGEGGVRGTYILSLDDVGGGGTVFYNDQNPGVKTKYFPRTEGGLQ